MEVIVAALLLGTIFVALLSNGDPFSPAKFFLASYALFCLGAWGQPRDVAVWLLLLLVLLVGVFTVVFESRTLRAEETWPSWVLPFESVAGKRTVQLLWLLTLPPLLAQLAAIQMYGGLSGYINVLGNRVIEFRGMGWLTTLTSMLLVLNLLYFAIGLLERHSRLWWSAYGVHLLIVIAIGLLSGSRSGILSVFAMQAFLVHYLRQRVSVSKALSLGVLLVLAASVLGVIRDGLKVDEGQLVTGLSVGDKIFQTAIFNYGVEPLEILVHSDGLELELGATFASVFTNPIPRVLWPGKPDTGGVVFTKVYTGDAWGGASNLTPTFLGEWIINFGWIAGSLLFVVVYTLMLAYAVRLYRHTMARTREDRGVGTAIAVVRYVCILWAIIGLMVGEFTNVMLGLILQRLAPLWLVRLLMSPPVIPVAAMRTAAEPN